MADELYFSIEWKARRKTIYIDNTPTIDEQKEIIENSILFAQSLVYILIEAAINIDKTTDDKIGLFNNIEKTIDAFHSSALSSLVDLEKRREELEQALVKKNTN